MHGKASSRMPVAYRERWWLYITNDETYASIRYSSHYECVGLRSLFNSKPRWLSQEFTRRCLRGNHKEANIGRTGVAGNIVHSDGLSLNCTASAEYAFSQPIIILLSIKVYEGLECLRRLGRQKRRAPHFFSQSFGSSAFHYGNFS